MSTVVPAIRIVGRSKEAAVALAAAKRAFPQAAVTHYENWSALEAALAPTAPEILILASPDPGDLGRATGAVDSRGWPRWAVVTAAKHDGEPPAHAVDLAAGDWNEGTIVTAMTSALRLHALEAANAQLRGDLRTISRRLGHDVRSPLNCISTAGEAMKDPDEAADSPRSIFSQSISSSVEEVVRLVDRISFILKATANPAATQPVILDEIVWGALQRLETRIAHADAKVVKPDKWPIIEAVPAWIDTIWTNLISNSLDHGGPGVKIELGWEELPGEYRFWIRDSGKGVPKSQLGRMFHPLDRLSELNAPRGFGLPIVHRLVELQGGRCGHEPAASGSGTFFFVLPMRPSSL